MDTDIVLSGPFLYTMAAFVDVFLISQSSQLVSSREEIGCLGNSVGC